jgi:hypothetical protein
MLNTFCLEQYFMSLVSTSACGALPSRKPRLIVLTDIGGDPDDQQSMIRLMTYSNEFDIEGLIATDLSPPRAELIREIVNAYGQVRDNLTQHTGGYPTEQYLLDRTKTGYQHKREVTDLGEGKDTEGSDWIISVVDRDDPRPVNIAIWGGPGELAQALWRVSRDRTPQQTAEFVSRIRVHAIGHQDETGPWILKNYPKLWYILDHSQDGNKHVSCYRGMWKNGDRSLTTRDWIDTHVRLDHGPLGALYPPKTWSPPEDAVKEGDTPSWFYFLENGLSSPADPGYGGWGGRFQPEEAIFRDAQDTLGDETSRMATIWRWRLAYQNDFQARMDWCVKPFSEANHNPIAAFNSDTSGDIVYLTTSPGEIVHLSAIGSSDPDGDSLSYNWFQYKEAGTYDGLVTINNSTSEEASFVAPDVSSVTIHVILQVKDSGTPNLYSYRRTIITIEP